MFIITLRGDQVNLLHTIKCKCSTKKIIIFGDNVCNDEKAELRVGIVNFERCTLSHEDVISFQKKTG